MGSLKLFLALLLMCSGLEAATYYVSPSGSDSNDGTLGSPWRTGNKAQGEVTAGDTVYFREGTYTNMTIETASGTPSFPIAFRAYTAETPTVACESDVDAIRVDGVHNYLIDGFRIRGGNRGIALQLSSNNIVQNCDVSSNWVQGICAIYTNSAHNIIRNCRVYDTARNNWPRDNEGGWGGGISLQRGAHDSVVENCVVYFIHGEGITAASVNNCAIRNCIVADTWAPKILIDAENTSAENNILFASPDGIALNSGKRAGGIEVTLEQTASLGDYADSHGNKGTRLINNLIIMSDDGIRGSQMCLNDSYHYSDWLIANNTIIDYITGRGIYFYNGNTALGYGTNIFIVNNLLMDSGAVGVGAMWIPGPIDGPITLRNNCYLFNVNAGFRWDATSCFYAEDDLPQWLALSGETNSVWIAATNQVNSVIPNAFASAGAMPRLWTTNASPPDVDVDAVFSDLAACSNAIVTLRRTLASPFNPYATNVVVQAGSPFRTWTYATDHGATNTVDAVTSDLLGVARSAGKNPSIGALEASESNTGASLRIGTAFIGTVVSP